MIMYIKHFLIQSHKLDTDFSLRTEHQENYRLYDGE